MSKKINDRMFEVATRRGLRWDVVGIGGSLSVEDIWTANLEKLNATAQGMNNKISENSSKTSYLNTPSKSDRALVLKRDILVHVIRTRVEEQQAAAEASVEAAERAKLKQIQAGQAEAQLMSQSPEEIAERIKEIDKKARKRAADRVA